MGLLGNLFAKHKEKKPAPLERTPLTIQVGDIITYNLTDYEVVGKITYRDGAYEWYDYQLVEGRHTIWLSAEMDDELEVGIYERISLPVSIPYPKQLIYNQNTFYLNEQGTARIIGEGRAANLRGVESHYADYADKEETVFLSLDSWGTEVEVSLGHAIEPYELKILAGSI